MSQGSSHSRRGGFGRVGGGPGPGSASFASPFSLFRFASDGLGTFAVTFSLMAPVLIVLIGLGLDFMSALSFKSRWDAAADAAALRAVQTAETYVNTNSASLSYNQSMQNAQAAGQIAGLAAFRANSGISALTASVTPSLTLSYAGTKFTAVVTYTATVGSHFGGFVGTSSIGVQGGATATASSATYINYYILLDISQSMGIGSTSTDMAKLFAATTAEGNNGCVFGCHVPQSGDNNSIANEQLAHQNGITLRIDAAKSAIQSIINQAQQENNGGAVKFAVYTMQLNPNTSSYTAVPIVAPPSNSYGSASSLVGNIDLGPNTSAGLGDTDLTDSLQNFGANTLPANGNGLTASSPQNYVFIITDGVIDIPNGNCTAGHCTGPLSSSACDQMKQRATVGVIYTTYLPIYNNNDSTQGYHPTYQYLVYPFAPSIQPNLSACASGSQYFFQADDGPSLITSMNALFASTQSAVRLTQ